MNEKLYELALEAINNLYFDQSVDQKQAIVNLENLKEEIDLLIETLEAEDFPE